MSMRKLIEDIETTILQDALSSAVRSLDGVKIVKSRFEISYVSEDSGQKCRGDLIKALSANGFSDFGKGKYHGGGGGPQIGLSAKHEEGGRIFAEFNTKTRAGERETRVDIDEK